MIGDAECVAGSTNHDVTLEYSELLKLLPFGSPWVRVDRVSIVGNEAHAWLEFQPFGDEIHHFDPSRGYPTVMSGVLLLERMNHVAYCLAIKGPEKDRFSGKLLVFAGCDDFRTKAQIHPGDMVFLVARMNTRSRGPLLMADVEAYPGDHAEGRPFARVTISAGAIDPPEE